VESWYEGIVNELTNKPQIYLIANKRDLVDRRAVTEEMGTELAGKLGAEFCEVSALADCKGISTLFEQIARRSSEQVIPNVEANAAIQETIGKEKKDCC
jgi:GTPase SAR1 family protein